MESKSNYIVNQLIQDIEALEAGAEDVLERAEKGVKLSKQALKEIRNLVVGHEFKSEQDEIYFFKHIKPRVYSKLKYYVILFNIESKRPKGSAKSQIEYFNSEINKLSKIVINT